MDFQDLLTRYFGSADLDSVTPAMLAVGQEQLRVDFGLETDAARRFGLWTVMFMLGDAPDLDVAFEDAAEREAARNFMDLLGQADAS